MAQRNPFNIKIKNNSRKHGAAELNVEVGVLGTGAEARKREAVTIQSDSLA